MVGKGPRGLEHERSRTPRTPRTLSSVVVKVLFNKVRQRYEHSTGIGRCVQTDIRGIIVGLSIALSRE